VATHVQPHKKSGGQLGQAETTEDPSKTHAHTQEHHEKGEHKAENMRYGQAISEQGVGGMTTGQHGSAQQEDSRSSAGAIDETMDAAKARTAGGYGGEKDMDRNVGA
jgi:hypothetical protein